MGLPLAGVRVLEFSHTIMGPCAGLLLADLGADVIKVEPAPGGDHTRQLPGFAAGFFATFNRNKRSLAVNLKNQAGQDAVHRLIDGADIVLENYAPGTMDKLGCGYAELAARNPRIIYLALKGFLTGPYEDRPALDEVVQFQSGLAYMTGPPGQPLRAGASVVDIMGATFGVVAVLAALRERDQTGRGQLVRSSLFESAVFLMGSHMAGNASTGEPVPPMPARRGAWGVYDVFATSDGQLFVGVTSDAQWARFCDAFELGDLATNPDLATNAARCRERHWLISHLADIFSQLSNEFVRTRCEVAKISWAPVGKPEDLFDDVHLNAAGGLLATFIGAQGAGDGELTKLPALPIELGEQHARTVLRRQPPAMAEHSHDLLTEAGYSEAQIVELAAQGAVVIRSRSR